jgi:hypothetical protein
MVSETSINTKMRNFYAAMQYALGDELLEYSLAYDQFIKEFLSYSGASLTVDAVKAIINNLKAFQKFEFIQEYATANNIDIRSLFLGNDSIYNQLTRIKNLILEHPAVYYKYTDGNGSLTNTLLALLDPSYIPKYVRDGDYSKTLPKFIELNIDQESDVNQNNDIEASWK